MAGNVDNIDDVRRTVPEKVVYDPKTMEIPVPTGKTLRIETTPNGEEPYTITANGADLIATITVSIREA